MYLKKKTNETIYNDDEETSMLSINQDFNFDINLNSYKKRCDRCTGYLLVNKNVLNSMLNSVDSQSEVKQKFILQLECDSCSFKADVLIL